MCFDCSKGNLLYPKFPGGTSPALSKAQGPAAARAADLKRLGGFRASIPSAWFPGRVRRARPNVFKRIRGYPPVLKSDPVYQPSLRDHRYKCRLRGLRFVKTARILPDIHKNFLRRILGIIRISKHLFGQRPDKAAITVYTIINGRPVTRCDSFQDGLSHNIPVFINCLIYFPGSLREPSLPSGHLIRAVGRFGFKVNGSWSVVRGSWSVVRIFFRLNELNKLAELGQPAELFLNLEIRKIIKSVKVVAAESRQNWQKAPITKPCK